MPPLPNDPAIPDWAVDEARAALKIGLSVPTIEKLLVSKGLSHATVTAAVNVALEERLQASSVSDGPSSAWDGPSDGGLMIHRAASILAACLCLGLAHAFGGGPSVGRTLMWLMLPVACIWFAELLAPESPGFARGGAWAAIVLIGAYRVVLLTL